jgi:hypothetical protein
MVMFENSLYYSHEVFSVAGDALELKFAFQQPLLCVFQLLEAITSLLVDEFVLAHEVAAEQLLLLGREGAYLFLGLRFGRSRFWCI